jgi:pyruvate dehydrogenase E1 component alpha subunit
MPYTEHTLRLLAPDGTLVVNDRTEAYQDAIAHLTEADFREFYRVMSLVRRFDI